MKITIVFQEIRDRFIEKGFTTEILQKLEDFSANYNRIQVIQEKARKFGTPAIPRFTILINDFLDTLSPSELNSQLSLNREPILNFVLLYEEFIRVGDDVLDSYFDTQNQENFKKMLDRVLRFAIIPWEAQQFLRDLPGNPNQVIFENIRIMQSAAEMELTLRQHPRPITMQEFADFTENRNRDFLVYSSLLAPFLTEDTKAWLQKILQAYVKLDGLLDDMCDVWDDAWHRTFNALLLKVEQDGQKIDRSSEPQLKRSLINGKTYDYAINLGLQYADQALSAIGNKDTPFSRYLTFLVKGCVEGLKIFREYHCFAFLLDSPQTHQNLTTFLLKPYPWTRLSLEELL